MEGIKQWIEAEGSGHWFFIAFLVILPFLFIWFRDRRIQFLIPSVIISLVILNPVFYKKWNELGLYAYWRILWIIPVIPVIASLVPSISEKIQKPWVKAIVVGAGVGVSILGGTYIYNGTNDSFDEATNASKLPDCAVQIADRLQELDDHPRVIFQYPLGTYIRQYTGEIDQLYGRDIDGYILRAGNDARDVHNQINYGDMEAVAIFMANDNYDYLVVDPVERDVQLSSAGFELVDYVGGYGIYKGYRKPTQIRKRNELGQLMSVSTIGEDGQLVYGEAGYATVTYEYDKNGNVTKEYHFDVNGLAVADSYGRAGYEREYDSKGHILRERYIDPDGNAIANSAGYAELRREYSGSNLIIESYYDAESQPVNRIDVRYASIEMTYDVEGNKTSEHYYNANGDRVTSLGGYASVKRSYNQKRLVGESYYDAQNQPVTMVLGYSSKSRTYDEKGNMTSESYFDVYGAPVNNINGYAVDEREYDSENNLVIQRFKDASRNLVITGSGYAEVHREFNERKQMITEKYYGADGRVYTQAAGHTAIVQEWHEDTLASRSYLNANGQPMDRIDGYERATWGTGETCTDIHFYDLEGNEVQIEKLNLVRDVKVNKDGWSDWMMPNPNTVNDCFIIGSTNLGPKTEGDTYTCQIEIEFRDVSAIPGQQIGFWAQGAQDGRWFTDNVWNGRLVNLCVPPLDGVYRYQSTVTIFGDMANISTYDIGFRCDYWASGLFRVRNVKIEKDDMCTGWSPGV